MSGCELWASLLPTRSSVWSSCSAHDGERAAAGLKAHELIRRHGLTWPDILLATPAAPPKLGWRDKLQRLCGASALSQQPRTRVRLVAGAVARHPDRKSS